MTFLQLPVALNSTPGTLPFDGELLLLVGVKVMLLIGALLYLVFAFIVVRQIQVMRGTLVTPLSGPIQIAGFIHLLFALLVLIFFAIVL